MPDVLNTFLEGHAEERRRNKVILLCVFSESPQAHEWFFPHALCKLTHLAPRCTFSPFFSSCSFPYLFLSCRRRADCSCRGRRSICRSHGRPWPRSLLHQRRSCRADFHASSRIAVKYRWHRWLPNSVWKLPCLYSNRGSILSQRFL